MQLNKGIIDQSFALSLIENRWAVDKKQDCLESRN